MRRTATQAEFVRGVINFWGYVAQKVKMLVDSTAAKAMSERRDVGSIRHAQARYLWRQDKVFGKELDIGKVAGKVNDADLVTKLGFFKSRRRGHKGLA